MEIEFEGKIVKPNKAGYYKCPYCPPPTNYPSKKWKTVKGFEKHILECYHKPSKTKVRKEEEVRNNLIVESLKKEVLDTLELRVGDEVFYVKETVVKPEYEYRGERRVRVRYESVCKYTAERSIVNGFGFPSFVRSNMIINGKIKMSHLCPDMETAIKLANEKQIKHEEHLRFSSECR